MFKTLKLALVVACAALLAACGGAAGGGGSPEDAARSFMNALGSLDAEGMRNVTCAAQQGQVDALASSFDQMREADAEFSMDVSQLGYTARDVTDTTATVDITGELSMTALGQTQTIDVSEAGVTGESTGMPMVREDNAWKVCPATPAVS